MHLIRGLHNLPAHPEPCAVTIGNFDGLHRGHQAILRLLMDEAAKRHLPTTLMLFEPQPMEYFAPDRAPARLTRISEKLALLKDQLIDRVLVIRFTPEFASLSAEDFVNTVLMDKLNTHYLLVGDDFRFGKGRKGNFEMLSDVAESHCFELSRVESILHDELRISSTAVREALAQGDFATADRLLGRRYHMCGRVGHGDQKGRTIGFPTINVPLKRQHSPLNGVFAVRVHGVQEGKAWPGVANIGTRPTVDGHHHLLEVHLFDFSGDLYGRRVEVEFVRHLRDEKKFPSFDALKQQIEKDSQAARACFDNVD